MVFGSMPYTRRSEPGLATCLPSAFFTSNWDIATVLLYAMRMATGIWVLATGHSALDKHEVLLSINADKREFFTVITRALPMRPAILTPLRTYGCYITMEPG